jgi:plasmid stability protein
MALELKPVQVRLCEEAFAALKLLADIEEKDYGEKARELLTRILLGEVHSAKVQAARFARALTSDNLREGAITRGNGGRK